VRIFISSVRQGLEAERDSLPGLVTALRHTPVRFEDFSSQGVPSRQACLDSVRGCDVYLLLLGPKYGFRFPETGQSATHDEFVAAQEAGLQRIVFRKLNVQFDPDQEEFARQVGDYGTGVFYGTYTDATDLQAKVVTAIRELEARPGTVAYTALSTPPAVTWASDWASRYGSTADEAKLEVHVVPIGQPALSGRELLAVQDGLAATLRRINIVPATAALDIQTGDGWVTANLPATRRQWNQPVDAELRQVRVAAGGQISVITSLPRGSMATAIFDAADAHQQVARSLRLVGALQLSRSEMMAVAVGLEPNMMLAVGRLADLRQATSITPWSGNKPVRVTPDEAVSRAALDIGADAVAETLVRLLTARLAARR
jgi:hypothetical protein